MSNDFYAKKNLWSIKQEFTIKEHDWKNTLFKNLDSGEIQKELDR